MKKILRILLLLLSTTGHAQKQYVTIKKQFVNGKAEIYAINHTETNYDLKFTATVKGAKKPLSALKKQITSKDSILLITIKGLNKQTIKGLVFDLDYKKSSVVKKPNSKHISKKKKNSSKSSSTSKYDLKLITKNLENGFEIKAVNNELFPISVKVDFKLTNMKNANKKDLIHVIPPDKKEHYITTLSKIHKNKKYSYSSLSYNYPGDCTQTEYDKDYEYSLPYAKNEAYLVFQGYYGKSTHKDKRALDFTMPINTKILAAREGIVVDLVEENEKQCYSEKCAKYNNYITVMHPDGTFAEYHHLKKNGVVVDKGDIVEKNQLIGYSGNTGWSSGPHLHFIVYLPRINEKETIPTKFLIHDGTTSVLLEEKKTYQKNY